jgi:hypothetical protein
MACLKHNLHRLENAPRDVAKKFFVCSWTLDAWMGWMRFSLQTSTASPLARFGCQEADVPASHRNPGAPSAPRRAGHARTSRHSSRLANDPMTIHMCRVDAVVHFAAFKAVNESIQKPLEYYRNNLDTTLTLAEVMLKHDARVRV